MSRPKERPAATPPLMPWGTSSLTGYALPAHSSAKSNWAPFLACRLHVGAARVIPGVVQRAQTSEICGNWCGNLWLRGLKF